MISRDELLSYLEVELNSSSFKDYAPNGLQVQGRDDISTLCVAVTASESAINQAIKHKADALLVHHGYFWKGETLTITGMKKNRLAKLLQHEINLLAYHIPLDCHKELGNNACLGKLFNIERCYTHSAGGMEHILWTGKLEKSHSPVEFSDFLAVRLQQKPIHLEGNKKKIQTIAWCSGGAQDFIEDAAKLGVDAYISGEISERTYYQAQELGIHYFACGHHATERLGVQALGQHTANLFKLKYHFIDTKNPI